MSIENCIGNYNKQVSQEEQRFRDLFSRDELQEARNKYFGSKTDRTWLEFLREETERKLKDED